MAKRALFLDRDGVVNQPPPSEVRYITSPEAFHLMPGIAESIRLCNQNDIPVVVVTNQKCIAIGRLSESTLAGIHEHMECLLKKQQAHLDGIYYCPHSEEDHCHCRKPLPGMLLNAATDLDLDLSSSWMVGDQPRDIQAGHAAGCRTLHISPVPCTLADAHLTQTKNLPHWIKTHFLKKEDCHAAILTL